MGNHTKGIGVGRVAKKHYDSLVQHLLGDLYFGGLNYMASFDKEGQSRNSKMLQKRVT